VTATNSTAKPDLLPLDTFSTIESNAIPAASTSVTEDVTIDGFMDYTVDDVSCPGEQR